MKLANIFTNKVILPKWEFDVISFVYLLLGIAVGVGLIAGGFIPQAGAASLDWIQTDWSGGAVPGVVTATVTTYDSATGVDSTTVGQFSLQETAGWSVTYANWTRRSLVTVSNSDTGQTDYQVRLQVSYDADMQADFSDLRFTDVSGTSISYWLQSYTASTSAVVWVKVPSLPTGDTDIYMYYGNASATSASSGEDTFILFDDFEDGTIDPAKWVETDQAGGNEIYESGGRLNFVRAANDTWDKAVYAVGTYARANLSFESEYKWVSNFTGGYDAIMYGWHDSGAGKSYTDLIYAYYNPGTGSASSIAHAVYEDGSGRSVPAGNYWNEGTQYEIRVRAKELGGAYYDYSTDGGSNWTNTYNSSYSTESNFRPGWAFYSGTHAYDNARIRKWMDTEPTSVFAAEQSKYPASAVLTSNVFNSGYASDWATMTYTTSEGANVTVLVRSDSNSDMSTAPAWGTCTGIASGTDLTTTSCVSDTDQYVQYQITMTPNGATTPVFQDITISYEASDLVPPTTNATNVAMMGVVDGEWTNIEPTFTWTAGADNAGGSGLLGYCIALDEADIASPNSLDPAITAGKLAGIDDGIGSNACPFIATGTSLNLSSLTGLTLTSGKQYYFSIKAVDIPGNIWTGAAGLFQELSSFKYDDTPPNNPGFVSLPANFISSKDFTFTWPTLGSDAPSDAHSGLAGIQYRIGNTGVWYGDVHNGAEDLGDLLVNDGSYTSDPTTDYPNLVEGNNYIYVRAWDVLGNVTTTYTTGVIKINTVAPSQVNNLAVTPLDNTVNSYAFNWTPPNTYTGQLSNITYCYTVNTLPSVATCNYTAAGVTSLIADAYATQPGTNVMYVVARDEAFNINYDTYASVQFSYSGSAPGIPTNMDVADISIKATSSWKLALTWDAPVNVGAGISAYRVYRSTTSTSCSTDPSGFTQVGSSSNSSYVDSGLTQARYYYCTKACDSANNCSAYSTTVNEYPTGKFTEPATLLVEPQVSGITTRRATISWVTDRSSDSRVEYGLSSGNYFGEEVGSSDQVTDHQVELSSLTAGTTYYYHVKWTDEDGNTGVSTEKVFSTNPAPLVKGITPIRVDLTSALVRFTSTGASRIRVLYGKSTGFGGVQEIQTSPVESTYTVVLDGLDDGTTYYYKIDPVDSEGFEYEGSVLDFTTLPRPKISNVQIQEVKGTAQPTVEISWETNTEVSSILSYFPTDNPSLTREAVDLELVAGDHAMQITGLQASTTYSLIVRGLDKLGNEGASVVLNFTTATDSRPPAISNLVVEGDIVNAAVSGEGQAQLIVTWDTDEPATSQVEFSVGSVGEYTQRTQADANLTYNHLVVVSNLTPSQVYHLRVVSSDSSFNQAESVDTVTITPKLADSAFELVINNLLQIFGFLGT